MHHAPRRRQAGLSFVEMAVVLAVASVMLGSAAPHLVKIRSVHALDLAAAQLRTDVQLARATAVSLGQTVHLAVNTSATASCYVIHTGGPGACNCDGQATSCAAPGWAVRNASFGAGHPVRVKGPKGLTFDGTQGTVTPTGTLTLSGSSGDELRVVINVMGRARTCRALGNATGYEAC